VQLTRDDIKLWVTTLASIAVGVSSHFDLFPWMSPQAQNWVSLVAFGLSILCAQLGTSPLPGKNDTMIDKLGKVRDVWKRFNPKD
jgi:hypothetical protein